MPATHVLREIPRLPSAPPPWRKVLWIGVCLLVVALAVVVLAAVAWMVIRG
jgi:hypothetical protein